MINPTTDLKSIICNKWDPTEDFFVFLHNLFLYLSFLNYNFYDSILKNTL